MSNVEKGYYLGAINDQNTPKIFPDQNDLDAAPKVGENYQKRIEEIINIQVEFDGGDDIENYIGENELWDFIVRWMSEYKGDVDKGLPLTFVMKREEKKDKKSEGVAWENAIGFPVFGDLLLGKIGNVVTAPRLKNVNGTVIETYLTITPDPERFRKYKIKAWQVEYPARGNGTGKMAFLNDGLYFSKDLTGKEFVKVMEEK